MADCIPSRRRNLNPGAPEFYPYHIHLLNSLVPSHYFCYRNKFLHSPSSFSQTIRNPSCYYSTPSGPSLYTYYTATCYPSNLQCAMSLPYDHDQIPTATSPPSPFLPVSNRTHRKQREQAVVVLEPKAEKLQQVLPASVSTGSAKKGESSICLDSKKRYIGHENELGKKEHSKAKSIGSNSNCERRFSSTIRSWRAFGGTKHSRQKHPVYPVLPDGQETTVMIRNIPNRYTREMLMEFLDSHCMLENEKAKYSTGETIVSAFDFLYLPIDFERRANKGYAFVNFTDARVARKFYDATNNQAWDVFHSHKIREIACARLQGKEELIKHFQRSAFECDSEDYLPVCFSPPRDGSGAMVGTTTVGTRISFQL